jgi:hypothetical protein
MNHKRQLALSFLLVLGLAALGSARLPQSTLASGPVAGIHTIRADDNALRLARDAGFTWIVQLLEWREIEPTPGEYLWEYPDWLVRASEYYGLSLALRLDHPPEWALSANPDGPPVEPDTYTHFAGWVATRYRGRVAAYIVWNEPNLTAEWAGRPPNPAAYVALLQAAYQAIKVADPAARVVSAGLAPTNEVSERALDDRLFLREMYTAGARGHFDALGTHPYGFGFPPDDPPGAHQGLNFARLAELRQIMVEAGDALTPVWATEVGWTTNPSKPEEQWLRVSEEQQASYLVGAYEKAQREWPWLELLTFWNLSAGLPASDEKAGYSILNDDYTPRPAYRALAALFAPLPPCSPTPQLFRPSTLEVLAPDVAIRLGDVDTLYPHWARLHCHHVPCRQWTGQFYVPDPGDGPWWLSMEIMQVEEAGNLVRINGHPLDPPAIPRRGKPDFASVWTVTELTVPPGVLQPGLNVIEVQSSPRLPVYHGAHARFESLQFRNVRLTPGSSAWPP